MKVNKCAIEHVKSFKILGIIIDEHLTWKLHINNLCSTLSCTIAAFWKINKYLDFIAKVLYYNGYILSRLLYCANIWSAAAPKYLLEKLYKMQKRAIRIVFDAEPFSETKYLFKDNGFMTLPQLLLYHR